MISIFKDELSSSLGILGCPTVRDLRNVPVRHARAYTAEELAIR
jgi:hypothetical protein